MSTIKKIFTNFRVIILILFLLLSYFSINPTPDNEGVTIRSVVKDSAANLAGINIPEERITPISREKIESINSVVIRNELDYHNFISTLNPNTTITIRTNRGSYPLTTTAIISNGTIIGTHDIGIGVYNAPTSNIRKGLDLQGGTRVLLKPETNLSAEDTTSLIANMKARLNIYGLSDLEIKEVKDRADIIGEPVRLILVEIAGATQQEVQDLLASQGKFEAKIGNDTAFLGGDDIKDVCRRAECSGIAPEGCQKTADNYQCRFRFSIVLSTEAAQNQADLTGNLEVLVENNDDYLSESLDLYLDDSLVDSLRIGSDLKGRASTNIQISGSGIGRDQQEAVIDALANMKKLQTVLKTGSLPVKLEIIKIDTLSPALGDGFIKNILKVAFLAILSVAVIVFIRYRRLAVSIPIAITMISEIVIMLGLAAMLGWNLDLAAIAGILLAAGTGVDHQIVITDETLRGENTFLSWKEKLKKAFSIIFVAAFTTIFAMIPLLFAGAGLLKGFALTTIIGLLVGVFITRPAYAAVSEILLSDN